MTIFATFLLFLSASSCAAWTSDRPRSRSLTLSMIATIPDQVVTERTSSKEDAAVRSDRQPLSRSGHDMEAWKRAFTNCPQEIAPTVLDFPGLPSDFPVGTYFRNGHGRFESDDGIRVQHMFDGDGLVSAVTFDPKTKKILFRNRFVRTYGYVQDMAAGGQITMPGTFGTKTSGGFFKNLFRMDFKNVANTNVMYTNDGVLYALWEGGWPYKLDPLTLETNLEKQPWGSNLDGLLEEGDSFAAHYRYDPDTKNYINFGARFKACEGNSKISLYEMDSNMKSTRSDEMSFVFDGIALTHDYALTKNWMIFSFPPSSINNHAAFKALLGMGPLASVINFDKADEALLLFVPRPTHLAQGTAAEMKVGEDSRIKLIKVPYHFSFHFANAFEDSTTGDVVVDAVLMKQADTGTNLPYGKPVWETVDWDDVPSATKYMRFTVNPDSQQMMTAKEVSTRADEFPVVPKELSTKKHRYAYGVATHQQLPPQNSATAGKGSGAAGAISKLDTNDPSQNEFYSFLPHEFVGEASFCPKTGADVTQAGQEDKGYLVLYVVNGLDLTTDLVVLDVEGKGTLEAGPVARMTLPTYIPFGLHGTFVTDLTFDF